MIASSYFVRRVSSHRLVVAVKALEIESKRQKIDGNEKVLVRHRIN
jgi:hypothetical protein